MKRITPVIALISMLCLMGFSQCAKAQWAVVDVGAITQLIQQLAKM